MITSTTPCLLSGKKYFFFHNDINKWEKSEEGRLTNKACILLSAAV